MCLAEIGRAGVAVHLCGDFIHTGQRVHDGDILLGALQQLVVDDIAALAPQIGLLIREALPLYAGDIHEVGLGKRLFHIGGLHDVGALGAQVVSDLLGHSQLLG